MQNYTCNIYKYYFYSKHLQCQNTPKCEKQSAEARIESATSLLEMGTGNGTAGRPAAGQTAKLPAAGRALCRVAGLFRCRRTGAGQSVVSIIKKNLCEK